MINLIEDHLLLMLLNVSTQPQAPDTRMNLESNNYS